MMQKGKRVHEQTASKPSTRKNSSPKKPSQPFSHTPQTTQFHPNNPNQAQQARQRGHLQLNNYQTAETGNQGLCPKIDLQQKDVYIGSGGQNEESSSRRYNPYQDMYRADLKYYGEYLDSCLKITNNGINFKWPYCFSSGS